MKLSTFSQNRYLTYPHCNGFSGAETIVLGQLEEEHVSLWQVSCLSGEERLLHRFERPELGWIAFDVALDAPVLAAVVGQELWILNLEESADARCIFRYDDSHLHAWDQAEKGLQALPSISRDGSRVIIGIAQPEHTQVLQVDVSTGSATCLFEKDWHITHAHLCPHDESWIGFCHEGAADTTEDRVWGWHTDHVPDGALLFAEQRSSDGGLLCLGHERWAFHEAAAYVVAYGYGISSTRPCGLYRISAEGGTGAELVSESDRYWHCNLSQDGAWAVVDTTGPHDAGGTGWANAGSTSDVMLIDLGTGEERFLARSSRGPAQTAHPHPAFSPDGKRVVYNEVSECGTKHRVCMIVLGEVRGIQ